MIRTESFMPQLPTVLWVLALALHPPCHSRTTA
jgi:hypothetical protein